MNCDVKDIERYHFTSADKLLLDTNIWFYIYGPQKPKDNKVKIYSKALSEIITAKSLIYIDVLVISEFINTYARTKFNIQKTNGIKKFKEFRATENFKKVAEDIAADVKFILKNCSVIKNNIKVSKINEIIHVYGGGKTDFNDQVLIEICKENELKLITHDGDFKEAPISILTANRKFFTKK